MQKYYIIILAVILLVIGMITYSVFMKIDISGEKSCNLDSDCACGVNKETRDCFLGNKNYVDTLVQCPDFCTGIAGNLEIKCINNECKSVQKDRLEFCGSSTNAECNSDEDCKVGGCSGQVCEGKKEGTITTCEFRDCYDNRKYGLSCGCVDNKCQWN